MLQPQPTNTQFLICISRCNLRILFQLMSYASNRHDCDSYDFFHLLHLYSIVFSQLFLIMKNRSTCISVRSLIQSMCILLLNQLPSRSFSLSLALLFFHLFLVLRLIFEHLQLFFKLLQLQMLIFSETLNFISNFLQITLIFREVKLILH